MNLQSTVLEKMVRRGMSPPKNPERFGHLTHPTDEHRRPSGEPGTSGRRQIWRRGIDGKGRERTPRQGNRKDFSPRLLHRAGSSPARSSGENRRPFLHWPPWLLRILLCSPQIDLWATRMEARTGPGRRKPASAAFRPHHISPPQLPLLHPHLHLPAINPFRGALSGGSNCRHLFILPASRPVGSHPCGHLPPLAVCKLAVPQREERDGLHSHRQFLGDPPLINC